MTKKIATLVRMTAASWRGHAGLYRLDPPLEGHTYVVVSAVVAVAYIGAETYIFGADENGEVTNWGALDGSIRGESCHTTALRNAGYEIVK